MSTGGSAVVVLLAAFLCLIFGHVSRKKKASVAGEDEPVKRRLPPGSLGWPYIGETLQLYSNKNPNSFFAEKQRRYGEVFKTHILGCHCVMMSSPEAARFVLVTKAHLFKPTFPASKERMLGPMAIFFQRGDYHASLRRLLLRAFMPAAIQSKVSSIEDFALGVLSSLEGRSFINTYQEMKTYALNVALLSIFGKEGESYIDELKQCYYTLERGYNSMPINLPGTLFHKSMKARRQVGLLVARIISCRRRMQQRLRGGAVTAVHHQQNHESDEADDLLASFMDEKESLTDDQITDNIIGVIFAARDTTASVLTWILKYLAENPSVLQLVTEEQEEIQRCKEVVMGDEEKRGLNWRDTKKMPVTCRVIQETMRLATILSFTFREAVQDVHYQGYLIPKGWKVLPLFRNIHHDPDNFPDPDKFDPSRFEIPPKPSTFMPFGNGTHACPGNELAKLEILVLLHHLTTKYRWALCGPESGVQFGPFALPMNGLPITILPKK
ncbi:abscisic acid 8'-hydroxylase 1-like [Phalaenopsis equestris]|uniref:abscisic acid 8'-hydroxylase 1-like n=1 Tax=Phalaenopsis equestris TaxID=78828 RepID=UPI0009E3EFC1|nr:abscisic acid 8'-hydroxylase 1-like [Phalaenopsis equestris]